MFCYLGLIGAVCGFLAVAGGACEAHMLKPVPFIELLTTFETAIR